MNTCPHCSSETISRWRKINATRMRPARCSACGGLSFIAGWHHVLASLLSEVVIWGSLVLALVLHDWRMLVLLPVGIALVILLPGSAAVLRPTNAAEVTRARVRSLIELAAIAALVGCAYLIFGNGYSSL